MSVDTTRAVTEQDFRKPEFAMADPKDYEFRGDGKIVRKDRWEVAVRSIASTTGMLRNREFEIEDVVRQGEMLATRAVPK